MTINMRWWDAGLGGTSLINANVSLELDGAFWTKPIGPAFARTAYEIDAYFERAREMLSPNPIPAYPVLGKLEALEHSAKAMGERFYKTPINVTFEDKTNKFGVPQPGVHELRRLHVGLQCWREKHHAYELPARCREPRRADLHAGEGRPC